MLSMCSKLRVSITIRKKQPLISILSLARSWCMEMTFPPRSAIILEIPSNCPGLSSNSMVKAYERPDFSSPRLMTRDKMVTSMFPPETSHTTFFPATGTLLNIAAATDTAPEPSAINFCSSISAKMAEETSSSVTVAIPST